MRPENSQEVHRIKIPATLHQNGRSWAVCTGFVGYRGVILWTDTLPTSEQLLKVTIPMVPGEPPFCAHAVPRRLPGIAHLGNALAVGLDWYALDPASNDRWQRFVRQVGQRYPQARTHLVDLSPDDAPDPVRRRASRDRQRFRVKFALGDRVVWCDTLDVSVMGMFLVTFEVVPVGTHLKAELSLPGTEDRWRITMVVRRLGPPAVPGLGVELLEKTRIEPPPEGTQPERTNPMIVAKVATLPRSQDPRRRIGARLSARPEALQEEVPENSSGSFELSLPGGRKLRVPSDVQPEALAKLLEVLDPDGVATPLSSAQPATQNVRKLRGG